MVYTKTIIHLSVGESGGHLPPLGSIVKYKNSHHISNLTQLPGLSYVKKQSPEKTDKLTTEFKLIAIQYIAYNPLYIWVFIPMTLARSHTVWFQKNSFCSVDDSLGEVLPYIRYIGMRRPKGYGF